MATQSIPFYTPEEYLELEYKSDVKHEYYAGQIYAISGGTPAHSGIGANILIALGPQLRGTGCRPFNPDLRVKAGGLYTYPDVTVVCSAPQYTGRRSDTLTNPTLLFEVLSESTEAYDRGEKFALYRGIEALQEYVLVAQDRPRVERFLRRPDGTWNFAAVEGLDAVLRLASVGCELKLAEVYEGIAFPAVPSLPNHRARQDENAE
jgi:Uma2 family endonuclease